MSIHNVIHSEYRYVGILDFLLDMLNPSDLSDYAFKTDYHVH